MIKAKLIITDKLFSLVKYELLSRLIFNGHVVNKGFITDGATVPRSLTFTGSILIVIGIGIELFYPLAIIISALGLILIIGQFLFPQNGCYMKSAIIHDYYLYNAKNMKDVFLAHAIFSDCLKKQKLDKHRRRILVSCVKIASLVYYFTTYRKRWKK